MINARDRIVLSERLRCIAAFVPENDRIADIGTDHALLPLWLLQNNRVSFAVASDIHLGPLSAAEKNRTAFNETRLRCILCDGLDLIPLEQVDTIIIAGLGGESIVRILDNARSDFYKKRFILQPMTKPEEVRKWIKNHDLKIDKERLVIDEGKLYQVFSFFGNGSGFFPEFEYYTGQTTLLLNDPLFPRLLSHYEERFKKIINGLSCSKGCMDPSKALYYQNCLQSLRAARNRIQQ